MLRHDNFNPRSPCGERPPLCPWISWRNVISIHAPRAGSDTSITGQFAHSSIFQSTLPVRGATAAGALPGRRRDNFNPRSPCGERRIEAGDHAVNHDFNPRSPCGERQEPRVEFEIGEDISIHAPRAGSDEEPRVEFEIGEDISIHAPRAGSDGVITRQPASLTVISIHAPRAGSDPMRRRIFLYPTPISIHAPRAGSDLSCCISAYCNWISIHAPRAGSDHILVASFAIVRDFNPRSPCGERPRRSSLRPRGCYFNPRSPCGERQTSAS